MPHACTSQLPALQFEHMSLMHQQLGLLHVADAVTVSFLGQFLRLSSQRG